MKIDLEFLLKFEIEFERFFIFGKFRNSKNEFSKNQLFQLLNFSILAIFKSLSKLV